MVLTRNGRDGRSLGALGRLPQRQPAPALAGRSLRRVVRECEARLGELLAELDGALEAGWPADRELPSELAGAYGLSRELEVARRRAGEVLAGLGG
jgi:hypothetical protein